MYIAVLIILLLLVFYVFAVYNGLIVLKNRVREAWSQIDVHLNRRADLIPNLVKIVRSYAKHESSVFEKVTTARAALMTAKTPSDKARAEGELGRTLKSLFAVAENYPQLRASENYSILEREMADTEDRIAYARQFYNQVASDFNSRLEMFPSSMIADRMKLKPVQFFEADKSTRKAPSIDL